MDILRYKQVLKYGWIHSGDDAVRESGRPRIVVFMDILVCYSKYKMWSNQYLKECFWNLSKQERSNVGNKYLLIGKERDSWQADFRKTREFLIEYTKFKYERASLREKRNIAYQNHYKTGPGLIVENNVNLSRQHYKNGTLKIGKNVLLAKNVFVDYSGNVTIKDNVQLTNGVIIETHYHPFHSDYRGDRGATVTTDLVIEEGAVLGSRCIILSSCHYIGKHARVGAGAVVTHDVPDFTIVAGVPAKIVRVMEH